MWSCVQTFDGKYSIEQMIERGITPADDMKITNDKLTTGTQMNADKSNLHKYR